jgi:hypothetical protein
MVNTANLFPRVEKYSGKMEEVSRKPGEGYLGFLRS